MSSVVSDPNGRKRLLFFDPGGRRRSIRLGKIQLRHAEAVRARVDALLSAAHTRQPHDRETAEWITNLPPELHAKLVSARLLQPRGGHSLGAWLTRFMESRRGLKPESLRKLEQTRSKLTDFFGEATSLFEITPAQAAEWRQNLFTLQLSEAAVKTHTGNAKTIMNEAVRRELMPRSAFAALKGGATPTRNDRYVTPAEIDRVLAACPDDQWRLLIALARYAGLRVPSEIRPLTWRDVDWDQGRLQVRSPKTERFAGHESRVIPIDPRLMALLREARDNACEAEPRVVTIHSIAGRRLKMTGIMARAGVEPWDDTWQTLRRSREIEWAMQFPQYVVSRWIGHSIVVSGRHYANTVPDELFDKAAGSPHSAATSSSGENASPSKTGSVMPPASKPRSAVHLRLPNARNRAAAERLTSMRSR